jgi:hypothetical protein
MNKDRRIDFLEKFLRLLGVQNIKWSKMSDENVCGTVIYEDGELQDFCWYNSIDYRSSKEIIAIIKVLRDNSLVDIDRITAPIEKIFQLSLIQDRRLFEKAMNELLAIRVSMIDEGEETDCFFVHM